MKFNDKTQILLSIPDLFKASIEEFSNKSFTQASTNEIIKNSNINKGSFYYRFANKEELFIALADHIIVTQIDLFNQRNTSLNNIDSLNDVLFELFYNLYLLNNHNSLFYSFITKHLYDIDSINLIKSNAIEPLIFRFKNKINTFNTISNFQYISILIDNLYQNFPDILLKSANIEEDLRSFIDFVLVKKENTKINKNFNLKNFYPEESLTYLITEKNQDLVFSDKFHLLSTYYINYKNVYKNLKKMSGLHSNITLNKLLINLINKSFKDISHLNVLFNEKYTMLYKIDKEFRIIILILIYLSLKEVDFIVIDTTINLLSETSQETILHQILPILSKTSKIVVLSNVFELDNNYKDLYIIDNLNQIRKLDYAKIKSNYENNYELTQILKGKFTYKVLTQEELTDFLKDEDNITNLQQIKLLSKIDYQTIIRNEVLE
jgi:AcrR family transcriptional regulator